MKKSLILKNPKYALYLKAVFHGMTTYDKIAEFVAPESKWEKSNVNKRLPYISNNFNTFFLHGKKNKEGTLEYAVYYKGIFSFIINHYLSRSIKTDREKKECINDQNIKTLKKYLSNIFNKGHTSNLDNIFTSYLNLMGYLYLINNAMPLVKINAVFITACSVYLLNRIFPEKEILDFIDEAEIKIRNLDIKPKSLQDP